MKFTIRIYVERILIKKHAINYDPNRTAFDLFV